ncbi:MAG: GIY-YIG nuclease family protein [Candidatus Gracilibacteria bacterium]|nr:GIY-YIG nuclease family protein [Candidatus Gracilibacteria bacterium]MDD5179278.1 GIY-YIG nuclease family protein [Candidatus Gracilibacteria bacterium]
MHFVYILQSDKDKKFYIGQTNNIEARLKRHNTGQVLSTKHRIPLQLIHFEKFVTRSEAMRREKYMKSLKGGNEFEKILKHWD